MATQEVLNRNARIITQEVLILLMSQTSLRELAFSLYPSLVIPNFTSLPGAKDCLKNFLEISCNSDIYPEFFYQLSQICHNLRSLDIIFVEVISNGLADLNSVQQNLKHLRIAQ